MKSTKTWARVLSLLLMLTMLLSVIPGTIVARADEGHGEAPAPTTPADQYLIDSDFDQGVITVHKYVATTENNNRGDATGTTDDAPTSDDYSPLEGAQFILVKIYDADKVVKFYNGTGAVPTGVVLDTEKLTVNMVDDATTGKKKVGTVLYNGTQVTEDNYYAVGTTDENGVVVFDGLDVGFYVLREITWPVQINQTCEDSIISMPMVNTQYSSNLDNEEWIYVIDVYPKNVAKKSSVEVTKVGTDGTTPLENVEFALYRNDYDENGQIGETWTEIEVLDEDGEKQSVLTSAAGKVKYENLEAGPYGAQYKLVEKAAPSGYIVDSNPYYFFIDKDRIIHWNETNATVCPNTERYEDTATNPRYSDEKVASTMIDLTFTVWNERPSLEKKVHKNAHGSATANWLKDEEYAIGEEITYQIVAYVPSNITQLDKYEITDIPTEGITDSIEKVTVKYGPKSAITTETSDFDVEAIDAVEGTSGAGFKLTFGQTVMPSIAGKYVEIQYTAKLNGSAVVAGNGNENTATVTYSNIFGDEKPATAPDYAIEDVARVYTYEFVMTKYKDEAKAGNEAAKVEFILLDKDKAQVPVVEVLDENDEVVPGVYRLAAEGEPGMTGNMVTISDGTITIKGVENTKDGALEYYLKEMKTIEGYNLLSEPFKITVNVTETTTWNENVTTGDEVETVKQYTKTEGITTATANIINKAGFVLPQTGSMGYLLFCAAGLLLIGGGAAIIFGDRKKVIR